MLEIFDIFRISKQYMSNWIFVFAPGCFDAKIHDIGESSSFFRRQFIKNGLR